MTVEEFDTVRAFRDRLGEEWASLADRSAVASIFQHPAWVDAAGGDPRGFVGMVFADTIGAPARGVAAWERPFPGLWRPVGHGRCDYLDLVAEPGCEEMVARTFASHMENRPGWVCVDLPQARPGSVVSFIPGTHAVDGETCPGCDLPDNWETFRKSLGKALRGNIGYYARALSKQGEMRIHTADAKTVDADMDAFFTLHQRRWRSRWLPGAFADRKSREYHRSLARTLLSAGRLRLHTLTVDGQAIASLYCFATDRETFYYLGGFDPAWSRWSPGTVLTAHAIRHAIEHDRSVRFDFLRGNEAYKYKWGAVDRHNRRYSLARGPLGQSFASAGALQLRWELALKDRMHARFGGAGRPVSKRPGQEDAAATGKNELDRSAESGAGMARSSYIGGGAAATARTEPE